jgi:hypothetical protein
MIGDDEPSSDLAALVVPQTGRLVATGDRYEPCRLVDADGVAWDRATGAEARDFCRWLQVTGKQPRPHWRTGGQAGALVAVPAGEAYAPSVRAHSETVLRAFYDLHLDADSGPVIYPFSLDRSRRGGRAHAHHNPMDPYRHERSGLYRPRVPDRIPRSIPDSEFNEIFAGLPSHRDRALVAFYVSTGARASELLSATLAGIDPGRQLITVVRKGPASGARPCPVREPLPRRTSARITPHHRRSAVGSLDFPRLLLGPKEWPLRDCRELDELGAGQVAAAVAERQARAAASVSKWDAPAYLGSHRVAVDSKV